MALSVSRALSVLLGFGILLPAPLAAQSWKSVEAFGYGAAGMVTGAAIGLASIDCQKEDFGCLTAGIPVIFDALAGTAAGTVLGAALGSSADGKVARGEPLGEVHRVAIGFGAVLAGASLGAALGLPLVPGTFPGGTVTRGDKLGSAALTAAGAGLGAYFLHRRWGELGGRVRVRPGVVEDGRAGIRASIAF
jgi:hypothetical protein